jgi:hypothetical protein
LEIQREIERFRGSQTAGEFIAAVAALLKSPDLASVDLDAVMGGEDPGFQLCLLEVARGVEASERASRASVRASVASRALQRLRQAQTRPTQDPDTSVRRQGTDVEYQAKLWTDEDGFQLEVSTLAQADSNAKDSVLARRLCDEIAARTPLGIQSVKLDPSVVHAALTATAAGVKERSYDLSSSSSGLTARG